MRRKRNELLKPDFLGQGMPKRTSDSNRYGILSSDLHSDPKPSTSQAVIKVQKPPPIILDSSLEFKQAVDLIGSNGYFFRKTSMGTKVFSENMDKYKSLLNDLKATDLRYHTHKVRDNSEYKMVIKGLHKVPTESIKEELLKFHGVKCVDIKEIITQKTTVNDALYLLTFNRMEVNKKILYKIKSIQSVIIYWKNQKSNSNRGPTQCKKCGVYGHGAENCFRQMVCFLCSSNAHDSSNCSLNNCPGGKIYKCFNCVSRGYADYKHKADDPSCPCRASYIESRQKATQKNTINQRSHYDSYTNFASPFNHTDNNKSYADQLKQFNRPQKDLFSMDELFTIFRNATAELKKCTTKLDQLNIIVSLLKYGV